MTLRTLLRYAVLICMLGAGGEVVAAENAGPPDLTGTWKLDAKHSDQLPSPNDHGGYRGTGGGEMGGGPGMGGGHHGGGGGMGGGGYHHHREGGGEGDEGGRPEGGGGNSNGAPGGTRPMLLPDDIHITQTSTLVSFEDTTGAVIREVATVGADADTFPPAPGAQHVRGTWDGGKLLISNEGPRGKVTETVSLQGKDKTMVIDVKIEPAGDMPPREFKRVYTRVAST